MEFVNPYDEEMEWDTLENKEIFLQLYKEASQTNEVILGDFDDYESYY